MLEHCKQVKIPGSYMIRHLPAVHSNRKSVTLSPNQRLIYKNKFDGNVKKKVREKKPSCRKERRAWNKASFEYNRIQQIERKLPASCSCLTNKLIYRVRDLSLSALPKFNQEEPVEVRLKLVTTKGHQRRRAHLQSLRAMVIKSGKGRAGWIEQKFGKEAGNKDSLLGCPRRNQQVCSRGCIVLPCGELFSLEKTPYSELSRKHIRGKPSCVHFHCGKAKEVTKVEAKHQVAAATEVDGEKHGEHTTKANGTSARGSRRHASACRTASAGEKLRDQSRSSSGNRDHSEGNSAFVCSVTCAGGAARSSKQCEAVPKGKRHQQKSRSKEVNDERCSPAGSSRPGSAKTVFVNSRTASVHAVEQTNNVGNNELAKKPSPLLSAETESTRTVPRNPAACSASDDSLNSEKTGGVGSRNADDQLCSVAWQSTNIELIPLEVRMQIIEKERTRKELFRKKNYAATVIQRTWRSYHLRQELFRLLGAKRQCKDEDKWSQEAAAFLLQVAWKKQLNHSPLKSAPSCKTLKPVSKTSSAVKTSKQSILKQIYGRSQEGKGCQPARPSSKLKLSEVPLVSATNLQYVNLLENMGRSKQFSYNMRPTTAAKSKSTRVKH